MRNPEAEGLSDTLEDGVYEDVDKTELEEPNAVLQLARHCISDSESYLDVAHRRQIEKNLANNQSRHPSGSKYYTTPYKHRSKLYVPKTRAVGQRTEAAISAAFFSTNQSTTITPANSADPRMNAAADLLHADLEYRLKNTMPWYLTVLGASQDAFVQGVCISHQYWDYRVDADGDTIADTPKVDLIPLEYFRWSPTADWRNAVEDSEYLVHIMPMTVAKILEKMEGDDPEWFPASQATIGAATNTDSTHKARENQQGESEDADTVPLHRIGHVHKIIVRREGIDWCFYVLGQHHLLTHPVKLKDIQPAKIKRPYTIGMMTLETHKSIPQSQVQLMEALQADVNEITNTRKDNVALALNKRFLVRRRGKVDLPALLRNVPGGSVMVNEHDDVQELVVNDVTSSSYKEQEFTNAAFDEIAGSFNQASINTNRRMGETAAGMELLAADANVMTEYHIELFATTWVQPVLQQVLALIQEYDDDMELFAKSAQDAEIQQHGVTDIGEDMLNADLKLTVSVGVDATDPQRKMTKLMNGVTIGAQLGVPINGVAVFKEAMGVLGWADSEQFVSQEQPGPDPDTQKAQMDADIKMQQIQIDMQKAQMQMEQFMQKLDADTQHRMADLTMRRDIAEEKSETDIGIAVMNDRTDREIALLQAKTQEQQRIANNASE